MRIKRIQTIVIIGLFLLMLVLPQLTLAVPMISNVLVTDITDTSAEISWLATTNSTITENRVNYGTTTALDQVAYGSTNVTSPSIVLTGLTPNTKYYFRVHSTDASGTSTDPPDATYHSFKTLAPTTYSITLDHACGVCGDLIDVQVCGEVIGVTASVAAAGTYHICWDSRTAANVVATFTTTGAGSRTLAFYMPEAKKGIHKVYLVDNTYGEKANADFEVLPSVKIDPEEGPVGTTVAFNGYGFDASQDIRVGFLGSTKTGKANSLGSWNLTYTIPHTPAGGYNFDIEAKEGTVWVNWVSKYFRVTPEITVTPDSGHVGQTIEVEGTGFASEEEDIEITFDGEPLATNIPIVADKNGSWEAIIVVPPLQQGTYIIDAFGESTRARDVDDIEFILGAGILIEPGSAYVGDTITVTGGGFNTGETGIRVTLEGKVVATGITADSDGGWDTSFVLPASPYGSNDVEASGDLTKPAVMNTLDVQARIEELGPVEGAPGDSVTLTGSGFSGNRKLTVTIGGIAARGEDGEPLDVRTQNNGNVNVTFRVPKSTAGKRTLVVSDEGGASDSVEFTVKEKTLSTTPLPISPNGSTLRSGEVTFKWQGVTDGTGSTYTLQINTSAGSGNIWSKSGVEGSSYTLTEEEALPKGTYYWWIKIVDDYGNESPWSDSIEFRVSPIPTWVWVVVGLVVLVGLMVVAYRQTKFKVTE